MSGIEVAGIVLGCIPLVISALEHYIEGVASIKRYVRYKEELESVRRRLLVEQDIYINTCDALLEGLVPVNELDQYLADPGGELWRAPLLEERLKERLKRSYGSYTLTIRDMNDTLHELKRKLRLNPDSGKVRYCPIRVDS